MTAADPTAGPIGTADLAELIHDGLAQLEACETVWWQWRRGFLLTGDALQKVETVAVTARDIRRRLAEARR